jgi:hypothetical protein
MGSRMFLVRAATPQELLPIKRLKLLSHAVRRRQGLAFNRAMRIDHHPSDRAGETDQDDSNQLQSRRAWGAVNQRPIKPERKLRPCLRG